MTIQRIMRESLRWSFNYSRWRPTAHEWTTALSMVQPEERLRIKRFVFRRDAKAALIGRLMIRKAVSQCLGIPSEEIRLERTEKGKPILMNDIKPLGFEFNVAHHGDYTVLAAECWKGGDCDMIDRSNEDNPANREESCTAIDKANEINVSDLDERTDNKSINITIDANNSDKISSSNVITDNRHINRSVLKSDNLLTNEDEGLIHNRTGLALGVDVMCIEQPMGAKSIGDFFSTMTRQFTEQEWKEIRKGEDERGQLAVFYRLWCLKESFVKAVGTGIGFSLQRIDFHITDTLNPTPTPRPSSKAPDASPQAVDPSPRALDHCPQASDTSSKASGSSYSDLSHTHLPVTSTSVYVDGQFLKDWKFYEHILDDSHIACVAISNLSCNNSVVDSSIEGDRLQRSTENLRIGENTSLKFEQSNEGCNNLEQGVVLNKSEQGEGTSNKVTQFDILTQFREISLAELMKGMQSLVEPEIEDWREFDVKEECPTARQRKL